MMPISRARLSLSKILIVDASTCAVMGALLALGSRQIGWLTAIPPALLFYAGLSLFPVALFMAIVAARPAIQPMLGWLAVWGNTVWVVASVVLLASGWIAPNGLGIAFIAGQALAVAGLAWLEHVALRGSRLALKAV
jgi:hypothetical protein